MQEPLTYFFNKYGFEKDIIERVVFGARYVAVMLDNGRIGVCATLGEKFNLTEAECQNLDLKNHHHRVFLNAYFNALLNYRQKNFLTGDILDLVDFKKFRNIVMVGYFRPVVEKMQKAGINLHIFDLRDQEISLPLQEMNAYLQNSDAAIVSATTVYNNTFVDICKNTRGKIYLLGPSALMDDYLFECQNVSAIFGSLFQPYDERVMSIIEQDLGTRHFLKLGKKMVVAR